MNKWIAGLFATVLVIGVARADVGAPAPSAKDLEKVVDEINYVETAKAGIVLSGYVDVGYIYNFNATRGNGHRFNTDETGRGDFNVNAVKLTLEKPLTDANEFQAGFRVDAMVGEDAGYLGGNRGETATTGDGFGVDSLFIEQAYVAIRAPYGNGIDIKAGRFVTWLGYEVIERPANLNITYGNLFENMIPLYHTGISAEYAFNDTVDGGIAVVNGHNSDDNFGVNGTDDGYGFMGKINFTNPGGNANWYHSVYASPDSGFEVDGATDEGMVIIYDTWGNWAPTAFDDKLLLGINFNYGYSDSDSLGSSTSYGAALYAKYQFTDIFSLAGRADYLHDEDGLRVTTGNLHDDIWSYTLTAGFDLLENLLVRAEYRVDFGENTGDSDLLGNDNHTVALQAVYTF